MDFEHSPKYQRWKEEGEIGDEVETVADDPTIPISASEERKAPAVANISSWNKVWSLFPIQLDLNFTGNHCKNLTVALVP